MPCMQQNKAVVVVSKYMHITERMTYWNTCACSHQYRLQYNWLHALGGLILWLSAVLFVTDSQSLEICFRDNLAKTYRLLEWIWTHWLVLQVTEILSVTLLFDFTLANQCSIVFHLVSPFWLPTLFRKFDKKSWLDLTNDSISSVPQWTDSIPRGIDPDDLLRGLGLVTAYAFHYQRSLSFTSSGFLTFVKSTQCTDPHQPQDHKGLRWHTHLASQDHPLLHLCTFNGGGHQIISLWHHFFQEMPPLNRRLLSPEKGHDCVTTPWWTTAGDGWTMTVQG